MNYAQQQRNPGKHFLGIAFVIVFHILLIAALIHGPARKAAQTARQPIEIRIIEEVKPRPVEKPPPPLPPRLAPPPPRRGAILRPSVPPSRASVQAPAQIANTVSDAASTEPAATPQQPEPAPPPVPAHKPAAISGSGIGVACPNAAGMMANLPYPRNAQRDGITGSFIIEFTVAADGSVRDPIVIGQGHKYLTDAAKKAVAQLKCSAQGQDVKVQAPFSFKLE